MREENTSAPIGKNELPTNRRKYWPTRGPMGGEAGEDLRHSEPMSHEVGQEVQGVPLQTRPTRRLGPLSRS